MSKIKTKLRAFFDGLECDLHHAVAEGLANKINAATGLRLTASDIYKEYESWQTEE